MCSVFGVPCNLFCCFFNIELISHSQEIEERANISADSQLARTTGNLERDNFLKSFELCHQKEKWVPLLVTQSLNLIAASVK